MSGDRLARVDERLATIEAFGDPGAPFVLELPEARALVEIAKAARPIAALDDEVHFACEDKKTQIRENHV